MVIICVLGSYVDDFYDYSQTKSPRCSTLVPQPLSVYLYRQRMRSVGVFFVRPARCSTPVPQPLSVMNNVKAWNLNRFMVGGGVADVRGLVKGVVHRHFKVGEPWCALRSFVWLMTFGGKKL